MFAAVAHKGRDADGGHYVSYVRSEPGSDEWFLYDDEKVSTVKTAKVLELKGVGDQATGYLTFWRALDGDTRFRSMESVAKQQAGVLAQAEVLARKRHDRQPERPAVAAADRLPIGESDG